MDAHMAAATPRRRGNASVFQSARMFTNSDTCVYSWEKCGIVMVVLVKRWQNDQPNAFLLQFCFYGIIARFSRLTCQPLLAILKSIARVVNLSAPSPWCFVGWQLWLRSNLARFVRWTAACPIKGVFCSFAEHWRNPAAFSYTLWVKCVWYLSHGASTWILFLIVVVDFACFAWQSTEVFAAQTGPWWSDGSPLGGRAT